MKTSFAFATIALLAAAPLALAEHECATEDDAVPLEVGGETYYLWTDQCQPDCLFSVWIIEETNGVPGLQLGSDDAHCQGDARIRG